MKSMWQKSGISLVVAVAMGLGVADARRPFFVFPGEASSSSLEIHHLALFQGDATIVRWAGGEEAVLIDGGAPGDGSYKILPYLQQIGVKRLSDSIVTHYHDHAIGGIDEVAVGYDHQRGTPGAPGDDLLAPDGVCWDRGWGGTGAQWDEYCAAIGKRRGLITKGKEWDLGNGAKIRCIALNGNGQLAEPYYAYDVPGHKDTQLYSEDDFSVVLKITYSDFSYVIAGDLSGFTTEGAPYAHDIESSVASLVGPVDAYRVNARGSYLSSNDAFLKAIKPPLSVLTGGLNQRGDPNPVVLGRLQEYGTVEQTRLTGDVIVQTDGGSVTCLPAELDLHEMNVYFNGAVEPSVTMPGGKPAQGPVDIWEKFYRRVRSATNSIDICFCHIPENDPKPSYGAEPLIPKLKEAVTDRGVKVRLVLDYGLLFDAETGEMTEGGMAVDEFRQWLEDNAPAGSGIEYDGSKETYDMHNKFAVFDNDWVWCASMHKFPQPPSVDNDKKDNYLEVHHPELAQAFTEEFEVMFIKKLFGASKKGQDASARHHFAVNGRHWELYFTPYADVESRAMEAVIKNIDLNYEKDGGGAAIPSGAAGAAGSSPQFLITEVEFAGSPDWVEIYCVDDGNGGGGVDISKYTITDLDGTDYQLGTQPITIRSGEYALVHNSTSTADETSKDDDANGNGVFDIYSNYGDLSTTDDQAVLQNGSAVLDACCWANGDDTWASEKTDVETLVSKGAWKDYDGDGSVEQSDCVDSTKKDDGYTCARLVEEGDENSKDDWAFLPATPGYGRMVPLVFSSDYPGNANHEVYFQESSFTYVRDDSLKDRYTGYHALRALKLKYEGAYGSAVPFRLQGLLGEGMARSVIEPIRSYVTDSKYQHLNFDPPILDQVAHIGDILHHKYALLDPCFLFSDPAVVTGSAAWSDSAMISNDEYLMIIHDPVIANQYFQEYCFRAQDAMFPLPKLLPAVSGVSPDPKTEWPGDAAFTISGSNFLSGGLGRNVAVVLSGEDEPESSFVGRLSAVTDAKITGTLPSVIPTGYYDLSVVNARGWQASAARVFVNGSANNKLTVTRIDPTSASACMRGSDGSLRNTYLDMYIYGNGFQLTADPKKWEVKFLLSDSRLRPRNSAISVISITPQIYQKPYYLKAVLVINLRAVRSVNDLVVTDKATNRTATLLRAFTVLPCR